MTVEENAMAVDGEEALLEESGSASHPKQVGEALPCYFGQAEQVERSSLLVYCIVKRAFDIVFSLGVIAVLLAPSLLLCLAIRLESPGCPIYSQKRVGRVGRNGEVETFDMYKFRSMHADADECLADLQELNEADGPLFKIKDDPRVTRIGRFIRKHSLAPVIIGTPGDGEPTKSLSHPENSSLDLQKCERRPGTSLGARHHYTSFQFLSFAVFGGPEGTSGRPLCACVQAPFAAVGTVA